MSITFNESVNTVAGMTPSNLQYWDGVNRYDWSSTITPSGITVVYAFAVGIGEPHLVQLHYAANPAVIVNSKGIPWPAGYYT